MVVEITSGAGTAPKSFPLTKTSRSSESGSTDGDLHPSLDVAESIPYESRDLNFRAMSDSDSEELAHLVGVIEEIRFPANTRFCFPSKVGGKPAWLIPEELPEVACESCSKPMSFLLQLYAPDANCEAAFHRSLLVFSCLQCRCFLKCFRAQLPLANPFYPPEPVSRKEIPELDTDLDSKCCDTCGLLSHNGSPCRSLPEYGIEIEEVDEIDMDDDDKESDDGSESASDEMVDEELSKADGILAKSEMTIDESEMDLFNEFTETAIERDSSFRMFKRFVAEAPADHVVYYSVGASPIWITDEGQMPGPPPKCEHCGCDRHFEFQIQPQLIYHLMKRLRGFPMNAAPFEWGVVTIFTCAQNCSAGPAYKEEFVFNQLEPSEWLEFDSRKKVDFKKDKASGSPAPKVVEEAGSDDEGEWM